MKKIKKIFYMILLITILFGINKVQANVTSTDPSVESGGKVTITIKSSETVYAYKITLVDSAGLTFGSATSTAGQVNGSNVNGASVSGVTTLATYTFTAPTVNSETKYSVKFNVSVSNDGESYTSFSNTSTVTVKPVQVAAPTLSKIEIVAGPSKTTYTEGENFDKTGMSVKATYSDGNSKNVDFTVTDGNNLQAGKTSVTVSYTENGVTKTTTQSIQVNKKEQTPEQEQPKLTSISIDGTKYTDGASLIVESDKDTVTIISGESGVKNYSISVNGESSGITVKLSEGRNEIVVTNLDNKDEKITVTINKKAAEPENPNVIDETQDDEEEKPEEEEKLQLTTLEIEDLKLTPEFSPDVYSYTTNIYMDEKDYTNIKVTATANKENTEVKIDGTEGLVEGENIVNIVLTSDDGSEIVTYQIIVNKIKESSEIVTETSTNIIETQNQEENSDGKKNIVIAIISAIILVLIIAIICIRNYMENRSEPNLYNYELEADDDMEKEEQEKNIANDKIENIEDTEEQKDKKRKNKGKHSN